MGRAYPATGMTLKRIFVRADCPAQATLPSQGTPLDIARAKDGTLWNTALFGRVRELWAGPSVPRERS
jgi:hypothetical protein